MKKLLIALAVLVAGVGGLYWAFPTLFFVIYYNTIYTTEFRVEDNKLHMSGMINAYTPEQLKDIFGEHPEIDTIVLGQMPGSIDDGANLEGAAWVAARGVDTYLAPRGYDCLWGNRFLSCRQISRGRGRRGRGRAFLG